MLMHTAPHFHPVHQSDSLAEYRAQLAHPCAVSWCTAPAVWSWQRTQSELRDMYRGKRWADARESWETVREVCDAHRPRWRADVYVPLGQVRAAAPAPAAKPRAARKVAPAESPALAAVLAELADTRAQLDAARAQLAQHSETWAALAQRAEDLRQARADLAELRAQPIPAPAPADMLAELVA